MESLKQANKLKFYSDAGHGWLAVKRELVDVLKIEVSSFSYQKGKTVYLEEDSDATMFIKAYLKSLSLPEDSKLQFEERNHKGSSPIRSYPRYTK